MMVALGTNRINILHTAALPFKTPQGTQAAVSNMAEGLGDISKLQTHLLTYGFGQPVSNPNFVHHRLRSFPPIQNLRSGPSLGKFALDMQMIPFIRSLQSKYGYAFVVAHHVEAAFATWLSHVRPWIFFAHTALGPELPTYFSRMPETIQQLFYKSGQSLDAFLTQRAAITMAISPLLGDTLQSLTERPVHFVPLPWNVPSPITVTEREKARDFFNLSPNQKVILYAGNLDDYQGWEKLIEIFWKIKKRLQEAFFIFSTASDSGKLRTLLLESGLEAQFQICLLDGSESQRRQLHAASDAVLVPRKSPGGLPIKLLDALSRGVPVVCNRAASAGLDINSCAQVVVDKDDAVIDALQRVLTSPKIQSQLQKAGPEFVKKEHSVEKFQNRFLEVVHQTLHINLH